MTNRIRSRRPRRIAFVVTSTGDLGPDGPTTGFDVDEAAMCWLALRRADVAVDLVSTRGGRPPMVRRHRDPAERFFLADPEVTRQLAETRTPDQLDPDDYAGVYCVGGHGTLWDFPHDAGLTALIGTVHAGGGVVAAICHGPAALLEVVGDDGDRLVAGRRVTCFTDAEEKTTDLGHLVPFSLRSALVDRGALHSAAPNRVSHVVVDGRLITGQNPASTRPLAAALVDALTP